MAFEASHKYARVTPRKARPLADLVRGLNANRALEVLDFNPRRAASLFRQVIKSALANASQQQGVNLNKLVVREIFVNEGPITKRGRPVARGRHHRILKKSSHLHVVLDDAPTGGGDAAAAGATQAKDLAKDAKTDGKKAVKKAAKKKVAKSDKVEKVGGRV